MVNKIEKKKVDNATFFNSGSSNAGLVFFATYTRCLNSRINTRSATEDQRQVLVKRKNSNAATSPPKISEK